MENKVLKHFVKICKHKYYVGKYCFIAGIPWRGIKHDMSKFSPIEFIESIKYYQGNRSPIDACKEANGYSKAWLHHKGRNSHHYEYWVDNLDNGGIPLQMPFKDACEMLCDYLGAGKAYVGKNFSFEDEYKWWLNKKKKPLLMNEQTKYFIDICLIELKNHPNNYKDILNKKSLLNKYTTACAEIYLTETLKR